MSWKKKKRKNMSNKGKTCKYPGCIFNARAKGYCIHHINQYYRRNKNGRKICNEI